MLIVLLFIYSNLQINKRLNGGRKREAKTGISDPPLFDQRIHRPYIHAKLPVVKMLLKYICLLHV